jgi:proline iminopeptidase
MAAYYKRLTSDDAATRLEAARAWSLWEAGTSTLRPSPAMQNAMGRDAFALAFARIECHYFVNKGFFQQENELLEGVERIRRIPTVIVQGRYDVVCPMETAWALHRAWPEAQLLVCDGSGHSAFEPEILHHLIEATERFSRR